MYLLAWIVPYMPFIEYKLNKKYIAKVLCVNKDKAQMQCNGKCHLKKQLEKANSTPGHHQQKQSQTAAPLKSDTVVIILYLLKHQYTNVIKYEKKTPHINNYEFEFTSDVFHPPKS